MNQFDLIVLLALALFAWLGARKGLVLTLCGLVVAVAAAIGAPRVADALSPGVAGAFQPAIQSAIQERLDSAVDTALPEGEELQLLPEGGFLDQILGSQFYQDSFQSGVETQVQAATETMAETVAASLAQSVAWLVVYLLAFGAILLLGRLLTGVLNLAARLPGLHFLNHSLGGVCGLLKGLVIVAVVSALAVRFGLIGAEYVQSSALLGFFSSLVPISLG